MSVDAHAHDWRGQLSAHPYEVNAAEFVRFRVDANDDRVGAIVRAVTAAGAEKCAEFRRDLGPTEADTLRLFAMRRTLQARRQASLGLIKEAMDSFALLPRISDVPWESWFKAALFVARYLGSDLDELGERFADVADVSASRRGDVAIESMNRVEELSQCQLVQVTTNYGTGFVEILVFRNTPSIGLFGAPSSLGVNQVEYQPRTNLAQLAASLADALDASDAVVTGPISQDQLAAASFSLIVPGSYLPTAGCLGFVGDGAHREGSFSVFVAELHDDTDIEALVEAASNVVGQAALYDARRLILLCSQPNFEENDDLDNDFDFDDVKVLARDALLDPATGSWSPQ